MFKSFSTTIVVVALMAANLCAQSTPVGTWKSIDDKTSEEKSHIEIYEQGGKFYGKVAQILTDNKDAICEDCSGKKKNQPVLGMVILEDMSAHDDYWKNGSILDPENGSTYGCSIWFEDGKPDELKVRGKHWTGLYRTQTWYRVK